MLYMINLLNRYEEANDKMEDIFNMGNNQTIKRSACENERKRRIEILESIPLDKRPDFVPISDAVKMTGIIYVTLNDAIKRNKIEVMHDGKERMLRYNDLIKYLKTCRAHVYTEEEISILNRKQKNRITIYAVEHAEQIKERRKKKYVEQRASMTEDELEALRQVQRNYKTGKYYKEREEQALEFVDLIKNLSNEITDDDTRTLMQDIIDVIGCDRIASIYRTYYNTKHKL